MLNDSREDENENERKVKESWRQPGARENEGERKWSREKDEKTVAKQARK